MMRVMRHQSKKDGILSDDAICASAATISIDGGGGLGCRLGLSAGGEESEEIHWCVKT